jgi:hypothetical protein
MPFMTILPPQPEPNILLSVARTSFFKGDGEIKWGDNKPDEIFKCTVTNYGEEPVLGLVVELLINWQVSEGPGRPYKTVAQQIHKSPAFNLGTKSKSEDYFFITNNNTDYYIFIPNPVWAYGYTPKSPILRKFKLVEPASTMPGVFLQPKALKAPATSLPSPTSPEGK